MMLTIFFFSLSRIFVCIWRVNITLKIGIQLFESWFSLKLSIFYLFFATHFKKPRQMITKSKIISFIEFDISFLPPVFICLFIFQFQRNINLNIGAHEYNMYAKCSIIVAIKLYFFLPRLDSLNKWDKIKAYYFISSFRFKYAFSPLRFKNRKWKFTSWDVSQPNNNIPNEFYSRCVCVCVYFQ